MGTDAGEGDSAHVYAFERGTARVLWRISAGRGAMSDVVISKGRGYFVTLQDDLICFDSLSGATLWSFRPGSSADTWRTGSPLVVGERVVFADRDGVIRAFDAASGQPSWTRRQRDRVRTWIAVARGALHFVRGESTLVTLDPNTGEELRRATVAGGPYTGPVLGAGDSLLLFLGDRSLTCFDLERGRIRWSRSDPREWSSSRPYVWQGAALAGTNAGRLFAFELADGSVRWMHNVPGTIRGIGQRGDTLYVGTLKGRIHALVARDSRKKSQPEPDQGPNATRRKP